MPAPNISSRFRRAAFAERTPEELVALLSVDHVDFTETLRLARRGAALTSRGNVYQALPFNFRMFREDGETLSGAQLSIDNVDRTLLFKMRSTDVPFSCAVEFVLTAEPDVVQRGPFYMTLTTLSYDALLIACEIGVEDVLNEPSPGDSYGPALFPGLHA